jgi:HlyD family secretion protein
MELDDSWDIYRRALEALETADLQAEDAADVAENRVTNAEKALTDAEDALAELKRGKDLDIARARKQVDLTRVALDDAMEDLEETLEGPDEAERELARARFVEAQRWLEEALEDLDNAVLVAPFAGIVTRLNVEEGDAVGPNDVMLRLVDPTELEVQATVDEADLLRLRPGQQVSVILDALPEAPVRGTLAAISTAPVRQSGIVVRRVTVALELGPQVELREGMTAQVNFGTGG